jgi:uncharacterized protein YxeA
MRNLQLLSIALILLVIVAVVSAGFLSKNDATDPTAKVRQKWNQRIQQAEEIGDKQTVDMLKKKLDQLDKVGDENTKKATAASKGDPKTKKKMEKDKMTSKMKNFKNSLKTKGPRDEL